MKLEILLGHKVLTSELVICDEIDDDGWSFQDEYEKFSEITEDWTA